MKSNKPNKENKTDLNKDFQSQMKSKKKLTPNKGKLNVKSNKFWNSIYDEEGEIVEKYIR